jgi:glucan phosphoethanolaminetransferase (alkaline phosphatase superfamily)
MWWRKNKEKWLSREGLVPALEVVGYVIVFTQLVTNGGRLFSQINKTLAPVMFLTLFCFSVLACGLMVFYKPYLLFVDKKGKEAMSLVVATTKWLGVLAVIVMVLVAIASR